MNKPDSRFVLSLSVDWSRVPGILGITLENVPRLTQAQAEFVSRGGFKQVEFDISDPTQEYAVFYYRRIVELAEAHGTRVTFVRMPLLAGPRWSDKTVRRFEEVVGAPLIRLPVPLRVKMALSGYRDRMHLSGPGREMFLASFPAGERSWHVGSARAGARRATFHGDPVPFRQRSLAFSHRGAQRSSAFRHRAAHASVRLLSRPVGEVYAQGTCVFDGYVGDPEVTEQCLSDKGFQTGDQGYFDDD